MLKHKCSQNARQQNSFRHVNKNKDNVDILFINLILWNIERKVGQGAF